MINKIAEFKSFQGWVHYYQHLSSACQCEMTFAVYLPEIAAKQSVPAIYWLSGLTCNHENFITKAGAQYYANQHGVALIMPDTSPRNVEIAGADDDYDLGFGAGFYVNATNQPWAPYFNMYDYVQKELPALCEKHLPITTQKSIMGHSMGGHGAMILALKNPGQYQSVSAFAPICMPMQCDWGRKALTHYLGDDQNSWRAYDSSELIKTATDKLPILIDQGDADQFLETQLNFEPFKELCEQYDYPVTARLQSGYDHSYYFIASFIAEHIEYHAEQMRVND